MAANPDPQQLFARQALRTALVDAWFDALDLRTGDAVADLGCGAGYVALRAAQRVGPGGTVFAVDSDAGAVGFLRELAVLHGLDQIDCRVEALDQMTTLPVRPRGAILSMVLHHLEDPAAGLKRISQAVHTAPLLIAEFNDEGPCRVGPPKAMRISRRTVETAVAAAGLQAGEIVTQTEEHWFVVCRPH